MLSGCLQLLFHDQKCVIDQLINRFSVDFNGGITVDL